MNGPPAVLVNASSATHSRPGEDEPHNIHAINRNHSEIVKFAPKDLEYDIVLGYLHEYVAVAAASIQARFQKDNDVHAQGKNDKKVPLVSFD